MSTGRAASWHSMLGSLSIWFVHFIGCWAVSEFSPHRWWNHVMAWVFTIVALAALGALRWRVRAALSGCKFSSMHRCRTACNRATHGSSTTDGHTVKSIATTAINVAPRAKRRFQ
ncbi:MAG: hypothetical protein EOO29_36950 [Comamonadaceae bacterium]|nr:MAG: hypothetical protein EOO29_36950 [Comamonadaceae bacterium]